MIWFTETMRRVIFVVCVFVVVTLGKHIEQKTRGKAQSEVKVGNNPMTHCADKGKCLISSNTNI